MKLHGRRGPVSARPLQKLSGALLALIIIITAFLACEGRQTSANDTTANQAFLQSLFFLRSIARTILSVMFPRTFRIPYPSVDVPTDTGVCTDEIIRIYRAVGVDLQKEVHEDMVQNFAVYPHRWQANTARPASSIDHRRVSNLIAFFSRKGESLPTGTRTEDYQPGDLVNWDRGGVPHIGMIVDSRAWNRATHDSPHYWRGTENERCAVSLENQGHYRYFAPKS